MKLQEAVDNHSNSTFPLINTHNDGEEDNIEKHELQNLVGEDGPLLQKDSTTLRVATYNISLSHLYTFTKNDPQESYHLSWAFRKSLIIEAITKLNIDILALQEVSVEQFHLFRESLSNFGMIGFASHTGHALHDIAENEYVGEIVPILYNKELIDCLDSKVFWLSSTPQQISKDWGASRPRIITCGVFSSKLDGKKFIVSNTHYDHLSDEALINSGKVEVKSLEQYSIQHNVSDIIYMGDRNCFSGKGESGNKWYNTFKKESTASDTRLCGKHVGLCSTFLGYNPDKFKAQYDANSERFDPKTLDLIFYKGKQYLIGNSKSTPVEYEVDDKGHARLLNFFGKIKAPEKRQFASDHCCLIADLAPIR